MFNPSYPPAMPLYDTHIRHSRVSEEHWARPLSFIPVLILAAFLFLAALGGHAFLASHHIFTTVPPSVLRWTVSLLPPTVLLAVILLTPLLRSPVWAYQLALSRAPREHRLRWNLAVTASAHIHCGHIAQAEWLNLLSALSTEDRFRALDYLKRVRRTLQRIPVLNMGDLLLTLVMGGLIAGIGLIAFNYTPLEAGLHGMMLMVTAQLFMFYMFLQRWQHIRRLMELEEVFDELLPPTRPASVTPHPVEDEVDRWFREEQERLKVQQKRSRPPALW